MLDQDALEEVFFLLRLVFACFRKLMVLLEAFFKRLHQVLRNALSALNSLVVRLYGVSSLLDIVLLLRANHIINHVGVVNRSDIIHAIRVLFCYLCQVVGIQVVIGVDDHLHRII